MNYKYIYFHVPQRINEYLQGFINICIPNSDQSYLNEYFSLKVVVEYDIKCLYFVNPRKT